jgi:hypothetical protein
VEPAFFLSERPYPAIAEAWHFGFYHAIIAEPEYNDSLALLTGVCRDLFHSGGYYEFIQCQFIV